MALNEPLDLEAAPGTPDYVLRCVAEVLASEKLLTLLPPSASYRAQLEARVPAGISVCAAHGTWQPGYFSEVGTLPPLMVQPFSALTPEGIFRVTVECVQARSGGMSSYHGFKGFFISLLVSIPLGQVWDARVEAAK
jgi:hypothetical protein